MENSVSNESAKKQNEPVFSTGKKDWYQLTSTPGAELPRLSLEEAINRVKEIVKVNEEKMDAVFANAPQWQARAKMESYTYGKSTGVDAEGVEHKEYRAVVKVPNEFNKEQRATLKQYANALGGTYTNFRVEEKKPDGTIKKSFPAQIEFGKNSAYSAQICAKIITGADNASIIAEMEARLAQQQARELAKQQAAAQAQSAPAQKQEAPAQKTEQKKKHGHHL